MGGLGEASGVSSRMLLNLDNNGDGQVDLKELVVVFRLEPGVPNRSLEQFGKI